MVRTNIHVKNYIALALCILTDLSVEQAFEIISNEPKGKYLKAYVDKKTS